MPRYFFDLHNDLEVHDHEGMDLADLEAARVQAITGARSIIADHVLAGKPIVTQHSIEVKDEHGASVLTIQFEEVLDVR